MKLCKHCGYLYEVDENGYCMECSYDPDIPKERVCGTCGTVHKHSDEVLVGMIDASPVQPCGHVWEVLS